VFSSFRPVDDRQHRLLFGFADRLFLLPCPSHLSPTGFVASHWPLYFLSFRAFRHAYVSPSPSTSFPPPEPTSPFFSCVVLFRLLVRVGHNPLSASRGLWPGSFGCLSGAGVACAPASVLAYGRGSVVVLLPPFPVVPPFLAVASCTRPPVLRFFFPSSRCLEAERCAFLFLHWVCRGMTFPACLVRLSTPRTFS